MATLLAAFCKEFEQAVVSDLERHNEAFLNIDQRQNAHGGGNITARSNSPTTKKMTNGQLNVLKKKHVGRPKSSAGVNKKTKVVKKEPRINFDQLNTQMTRFKSNLKMTCSVIIDDIVDHLDSFFTD